MLPRDPTELRKLPGVGDYTAGAVASIAFGVPVPAVDGNVRRVVCRLLGEPEMSNREVREEAALLVDPDQPGEFNEAVMELGATVCTPRSPRCADCPVNQFCAAKARGTTDTIPARRPAPATPRATYATAVAVDADGKTVLVRRPETGLLAGMWEFPATELDGPAADPADTRAAAAERLAALGITGEPADQLAPVTHAFSHLRATYHPVVVCVREEGALARAERCEPGTARADPAHFEEWPLPVAQQRIGSQLGRWLRSSAATGREITRVANHAQTAKTPRARRLAQRPQC